MSRKSFSPASSSTRDGGLRPSRSSFAACGSPKRASRALRDLAEGILLANDLVAVLVGGDVVGAGLDRRLEHRVGVGHGGVEGDEADAVEHEGDGARLGEVAAGLRERGADVGGGAVAVVGQRLDDQGGAAGAIALVADLLVVLAVAARAPS